MNYHEYKLKSGSALDKLKTFRVDHDSGWLKKISRKFGPNTHAQFYGRTIHGLILPHGILWLSIC